MSAGQELLVIGQDVQALAAKKNSLADVQVDPQFLRRIARGCYAECNPDERYLSAKAFPT